MKKIIDFLTKIRVYCIYMVLFYSIDIENRPLPQKSNKINNKSNIHTHEDYNINMNSNLFLIVTTNKIKNVRDMYGQNYVIIVVFIYVKLKNGEESYASTSFLSREPNMSTYEIFDKLYTAAKTREFSSIIKATISVKIINKYR